MSIAELLREFARPRIDRLVRQTIADLRGVRTGASGDDSPLRDAWDEYCAQVQFQESVLWDAYEETLHQFVDSRVRELAALDLKIIWLQTEEGFDWLFDHPATTVEIPAEAESVVALVTQEVRDKASDWSNPRLRKYLDRPTTD